MAVSSYRVESGVQLLARLSKKPTITNVYPQLFQSRPKPGEVIELIHSECTPNFFLKDIICTALLSADFGGAETGVLIFNCSGNLNYETLVSYMGKKIMSSFEACEKEVDDIVEKQFKNLFVVEIHDATQYYTTIFNLENILLEHPNITMVIFNTITAFYWSEQSFKIMKMDTYLKKVLLKIQNATKEHKVIVFYIKPDYFNSNKDVMDNLDVCYEIPSLKGNNYRIGVYYDRDSTYIANVKSYNVQLEKRFCIKDDLITWI